MTARSQIPGQLVEVALPTSSDVGPREGVNESDLQRAGRPMKDRCNARKSGAGGAPMRTAAYARLPNHTTGPRCGFLELPVERRLGSSRVLGQSHSTRTNR